MISGISGMGGMMGAERFGGMRPNPQEMFQRSDADGSGGIDQEELTALTDKLSALSGSDIDAESLVTAFDVDADGALSAEEMKTAMGSLKEEMGFPPGGMGGRPPMGGLMDGPMGGPMGVGGMPLGGASAMYGQNSVETAPDLSALLEGLSDAEEDAETDDLTEQWLNALNVGDESYHPIDTLI